MPTRHPHLSKTDRQRAIRDAARCKAGSRHRLDPVPTPPGAPRPLYGTLICYRCELCGTYRFDAVSRMTGQLFNRSYDYPDWYVAAGAEGRDAAWWRVAWWDTLDDSLFLDATEVAENVTPIRKRRSAS